MSKKKSNANSNHTVHITMPERTSEAEAKAIIVEALLAYDEAKIQKENERKQAEQDKWQKKLGIKDYAGKNRFVRPLMNFFNSLMVILRFMFMKKSEISGDHAMSGLMKLTVSLFFDFIKLILWGISLCLILSYPIQCIANIDFGVSAQKYITQIALGFLALFGAQMFRMASIEIDETEDKQVVFDAFTAVAAIVAIIVSIVLN